MITDKASSELESIQHHSVCCNPYIMEHKNLCQEVVLMLEYFLSLPHLQPGLCFKKKNMTALKCFSVQEWALVVLT